MNSAYLSAAFALSAAAAWGSGDFTGGWISRRLGPFQTVLASYTVGLVALVVVALARAEPLPPVSDLLWGALAGMSGMLGLGFLFRGFAAGRMGIVAPVSAVLTAALPVVFAALTQGMPRELQLLGFGLAMFSVWLLSRPEPLGGRPAGLGMGILAGLGFGGFFTLLSQVSEQAVFWPLIAGRLAACIVMVAFALLKSRQLIPPRSAMGLLVLAGVLDVAGNLFFLLAVQSGRLDVASVLASLYPAVTALLARLVTGENLARMQVMGLASAILAIVMITI
jgi:drug/metabolite transporter (DMT)-like permease